MAIYIQLLWVFLLLVNIASFALYGSDKVRARREDERIPERVLLGVALLGGALGAGLGMWLFRHKTRHWRFVVLVPLFMLLHLYLLCRLFF
ncbi:MAG: DUF1294 domain-containing protein [Bacteroidaceae bacterium]|nr:DUF1294 domain-containing protein [Bacteroidaceae bacterium]